MISNVVRQVIEDGRRRILWSLFKKDCSMIGIQQGVGVSTEMCMDAELKERNCVELERTKRRDVKNVHIIRKRKDFQSFEMLSTRITTR